MARPPLELAQVELPVSARGYSRAATDQLLKTIALEYDELWREAAALRRRLEQGEAQERELAATIAAAGRFARETRRHAKRHARGVVKRAESAADHALHEAEARRLQLASECEELTRRRALLEAELCAVRDAARGAGEQLDTMLASAARRLVDGAQTVVGPEAAVEAALAVERRS